MESLENILAVKLAYAFKGIHQHVIKKLPSWLVIAEKFTYV